MLTYIGLVSVTRAQLKCPLGLFFDCVNYYFLGFLVVPNDCLENIWMFQVDSSMKWTGTF